MTVNIPTQKCYGTRLSGVTVTGIFSNFTNLIISYVIDFLPPPGSALATML